jgi:hypothetical protein
VRSRRRSKSKALPATGTTVTAFTPPIEENWLAPQFVVGRLYVQYVTPLNYDKVSVDGVGVDETTVKPIANPTRELVRILKAKGREWQRQDSALVRKRGREEDSFREKKIDKEFGVHIIRDDAWDAFDAFYKAMQDEDQRLTAERQAEVAELVKAFEKKGTAMAGKGRQTARKPATKFAHLRKKMEKSRIARNSKKK